MRSGDDMRSENNVESGKHRNERYLNILMRSENDSWHENNVITEIM